MKLTPPSRLVRFANKPWVSDATAIKRKPTPTTKGKTNAQDCLAAAAAAERSKRQYLRRELKIKRIKLACGWGKRKKGREKK